MFISTENEEQISRPLENGVESNLDSPDGLLSVSEMPESPLFPAVSTDVNVVPEHEKNELETKIVNLEGEIVGLRHKQRSLDEKRREALNKILDSKGCIRVFCRIRPILSTIRRIHKPIVVGLGSEKIVVGSAGSRKEFGFDKVFSQEATQEDVFVEVEPILRSALDGHNVCILAYGQTGTGKTFTMDGTSDSPGLVLRALEDLIRQASFDNSASFTFSISMLEVYLGNLRDLLAPKPSSRAYGTVSRCNLNIQTDLKGLVEIEGLTEVEFLKFYKSKLVVHQGLTRITIFRRGDAPGGGKAEVSKLWLVDLGGSERLLKTGATGQTLDEGRAINLSLSALGDVIAALRRKRGHVPYRNSKLTQILKDSLGDGSKVLMLVHVSQCEEDVGETTCSLSFAQRARGIESTRELTEDLKKQKEKRIAVLEEDLRDAEEEYKRVGNQIQKAEFLLSENRKLFSAMYQLLADEGKTPTSAKEEPSEFPATPKASEKVIKRKDTYSVPRFMNPTMASRQRQTAAEREVDSRARILRLGTRSSIQISGSQSLSYLDPHFKALLRNPNKKSRHGYTSTPLAESTKCNVSDSKPISVSRTKMVSSSDPNLKATLGRHRRRMSDLI
ncbi:P-loop containing nucleoside triphosphate hydrolases superfamily protein [Actinidia rufa]|uniref:P-loop containing nucleoside triphosphate hydrolases superfamily protein n=1 Tax=Actinidia rufa TaxID=165716 RepID=A0A7J0FW80_9ERIC|nr:P-loop containing nucleoside triphosphate hydrolases superfamily protein [Actinidia rufa]